MKKPNFVYTIVNVVTGAVLLVFTFAGRSHAMPPRTTPEQPAASVQRTATPTTQEFTDSIFAEEALQRKQKNKTFLRNYTSEEIAENNIWSFDFHKSTDNNYLKLSKFCSSSQDLASYLELNNLSTNIGTPLNPLIINSANLEMAQVIVNSPKILESTEGRFAQTYLNCKTAEEKLNYMLNSSLQHNTILLRGSIGRWQLDYPTPTTTSRPTTTQNQLLQTDVGSVNLDFRPSSVIGTNPYSLKGLPYKAPVVFFALPEETPSENAVTQEDNALLAFRLEPNPSLASFAVWGTNRDSVD